MAVDTGLPGPMELMPHLPVLDKLLREQIPDEKRATVNRLTEQLTYYLRGACYALDLLEGTRNAAADEFVKLNPDNPRGYWVIIGDLSDQMGFAADLFLTYMRRTLDALVNYLAKCPIESQLPASFNDLVKGLNTGKHTLDEEIKDLILGYWENVGSKVKGYRDQTLHKAVIISNCVMFYHPIARSVGLRMCLPHDAQEKSPVKLSYEPHVDAMGFFVEALYATVEFVNRIVERLIDLMSSDSNVRDEGVIIIFNRGGPLTSDMLKDIRGEPVPYTVTAAEVVRRAVEVSARPRRVVEDGKSDEKKENE